MTPTGDYELKELEDFIIPSEEFNHDEYEIREYLKKNLDNEINLEIYNLKLKKFCYVKVIPSINWKHSDMGCLGAIICYENFLTAHYNLLKITKVLPNSLSGRLGLVPYEDYIIGIKPNDEKIISLNSSKGSNPISLFTNLLKSNQNRDVEFWL